MAKKVVSRTEYTDDLDGSTAASTVSFGYAGANYEIDLSKANARALERLLKPYVDNGRKVRASHRKASSRRGHNHDLAHVRAWARSAGYDVSERGRVASAVLQAYDAAH